MRSVMEGTAMSLLHNIITIEELGGNEIAAGGLDGYAIHAMVIVNYGRYIPKLWHLLRSAAGRDRASR